MAELDLSRPIEADVAIAGAGLGGLITGAILARRGLRVVIADGARRIGGRGGGTPYGGWWLDGGQRDGLDVTDLQIGLRWGQVAAREAGVQIPLRAGAGMRVHLVPETPGAGPVRWTEMQLGPAGFAALARDVLGCPESQLDALGQALARLAAATPTERRAAIPLHFGDWLRANVAGEPVRRALASFVSVVFCDHPERASTGRFMGFLAGPEGAPPAPLSGFADHPGAGGMQGLMLPWAEALEAAGGRILLDTAPREVLFDGTRAAGLLALTEGQLVAEIRARAVVLAAPLWEALRWLAPERVDPALARLARELEDESADALGWFAGLRRLPRLRTSGEPDDYAGWNRLLVGDERRYHGGFHLPSLRSRAAAPPGRHLLHAYVVRWLRRDERRDWAGSAPTLERVVAYLRALYVDFDDCVEWSARQWVERPSCMAWYWAPVERHGPRATGCPGVYLAGATVESDTGPVDVCAHAALQVCAALAQDA